MKLYWLLLIPLVIVLWLIYRAVPCEEEGYTIMGEKEYIPADNFWKVNRR
jgi:hypothetical protein